MKIHSTRSGDRGVYGHPVTRCDAGGCAAGTEFYFPDLEGWPVGAIADDGQPEPDDETPAVLRLDLSDPAPTPCVNCGSPACEWPGECFTRTCERCNRYLENGKCPSCGDTPTPEEILDILNDLIEWNAFVMQSDAEVWERARAIRDRLVVK